MGRPESIQWQHRRWLGDNTVLQMDWDATAMHFHLLMMSIQEKPPGSIPNDMAAIRRWLRSPSEDTWRRVRPQIFAAWQLREDRWFNTGMVETFDRKARFSNRYENGTRMVRESPENQDNSNRDVGFEVDSKKSEPEAKPRLEEETPEDMPLTNYTRMICEQIGLPIVMATMKVIVSSLESVHTTYGLSPAASHTFLLGRAKDARDRGETVDYLWFLNGRWNGNANGSKVSASAARAERSKRNILDGIAADNRNRAASVQHQRQDGDGARTGAGILQKVLK